MVGTGSHFLLFYRVLPGDGIGIVFGRESVVDKTHGLINDSPESAAFVADSAFERYINLLTQAEVIRTIATAQGPFGRNCDYLFQLVENMHELGSEETELEYLVIRVKAYQAKI